MTRPRAARIAAALFVVTAVLFVMGVSTEPDDQHEATQGSATHDEGREAEEDEGAHDEEGEEETILGIDIESPAAIALEFVASVLLAGALWFRPIGPVLVAGAVFGLAFAVLDIAEIAHQVDESDTGLAAPAAVIAAGHLAAAASGPALRARDT